MLYIVHNKVRSDASCTRVISYAQGFANNGIPTKLVFLLPAETPWTNNGSNNYETQHCGEQCPRILKHSKICSYIWAVFYVVCHMSRNDVLFCPSPNWLLMRLARIKRIKVYTEFTEVPFHKIQDTAMHRVIDFLAYRSARKSNGCFVISQGLYDYYKSKKIPVLSIINMFVDSSRFRNKNIQVDKHLISYCGTVSTYKDGVDVLIKSFAEVLKKHPDMKLKIIGAFANANVEKELKHIIDALELSDRVIFTGRVNALEMPKLLLESSILALARPNNIQAKYGFPTKLGEYLCTSRPVVVTDVGELHAFLKDKESCVFARPNNVGSFADCLNWVIENPKESEVIGNNGKRVALNFFSADTESYKAAQAMQLL